MSHPTHLYRHWNAAGELLYVGVTKNLAKRFSTHQSSARWFDDIAKVTSELFPTLEEARAAEARAIREERPAHNYAGAHCDKRRAINIGHLNDIMEGRWRENRDAWRVVYRQSYSASEFSRAFGISDSAVYTLIKSGALRCVNKGRRSRYVIPMDAVREYFASLSSSKRPAATDTNPVILTARVRMIDAYPARNTVLVAPIDGDEAFEVSFRDLVSITPPAMAGETAPATAPAEPANEGDKPMDSRLDEIPDEIVLRANELDYVISLAADDEECAEVFPGNKFPFVLRTPVEGRLYDVGLPPMPLGGILDALKCTEAELAGDKDAWRAFGKGWLWRDS